jgi:hypothetical protein
VTSGRTLAIVCQVACPRPTGVERPLVTMAR